MTHPVSSNLFFLYGPPGSGKSTIGRLLAQALELPFTDLDALIETRTNKLIPDIFAGEGEAAFRKYEREALLEKISDRRGVVALGGGCLLNDQNRTDAEAAGTVLFLETNLETLEARLRQDAIQRPLLRNSTEDLHNRLEGLLIRRHEHYASFPTRINTVYLTPAEAAWQAQICLGAFRISGMGAPYDVRIVSNGINATGAMLLERGLKGPIALVCDSNVAGEHGKRVAASLLETGYQVHNFIIPAGEEHKTLDTILKLWNSFIEAGLERSSTIVAVGGGVLSDMAGFAAATFLRGVPWVVVPTTLLSMCDASLGGKTGFDLPRGKNLVGAFHSPRLVLADPHTLLTLPEVELRCGLAEVVKHGVIQDKELYDLCARGWAAVQGGDPAHPDWSEVVRHSMATKVNVVNRDPYEKGERAALNLGHTIGHGLEQATHFALRHGEAVAIGMVIEAGIAVQLGMAQPDLPAEIARTLEGLGLPTRPPAGIDREMVRQAMSLDKKRAGGKVRFALPEQIGSVKTGVALDLTDDLLKRI
jgi:shikimate kinase / 3-dehydroquinate synthase